MIAVALKGLAGRKVRALLTAFAVVIGVSMVSGTFILTDTMQKTFDGLFAASYERDRRRHRGQADRREVDQRRGATVPASLLADVRALPEVEAAGGTVSPAEVNSADIIGRDGKAVAQESLGASIDAGQPALQPAPSSRPATWPAGPGRSSIDAGTADEASTTRSATPSQVATPGKTASYRITGTASFGEVDSLGFGSIAVWDVATAQALLEREGRFDSISIAAKRRHVAGGARARRAAARPEHARGQGQRQAGRGGLGAASTRAMSYIRYFLLGFGGIALFVGAFVIFNTLSITVAQRTREFATLRTLGASRKQVLRSVRLEGLVIGLLASTIGLFLGFGDREGHARAVQRDGRRPARGRHRVRARAR